MYFEPSKKTYYRFPSVNSTTDFDMKFYFPEKSDYTEENTRFEAQLVNHMPERETYYDV